MARSATGGLRFATPEAARAHADRLEQLADEKAAEHRRSGDEVKAEQVVDRAHQQAGSIRAAADAMDTKKASGASSRSGGSAGRSKPRTSAPRSASQRPSAGRGRRAQGTGLRFPRWRPPAAATAPYSGYGALAWRAAGLTFGIAVLSVFIASRRGPGTFAAATSVISKALALVLEPTDPLAPLTGQPAGVPTPLGPNAAIKPAPPGAQLHHGPHPGYGPHGGRHHARSMTPTTHRKAR